MATADPEGSDQRALRAHVFSGAVGLRALERDWRTLTSTIEGLRFFHGYEWYESYIDNLEASPDSVHFVLLKDKDRPVAVFPLRYTVNRTVRSLVRVWEFPRHAHTDLSDFIFAKTRENRHLLAELVAVLNRDINKPWDLISLKGVLADSAARFALQYFDHPMSEAQKYSTSKYIHCNGPYETVILGRMSPKLRKNVLRKERKCRRMGTITFDFVAEQKALQAAFSTFLDVEAAGWKGQHGTRTAIKFEPRVEAFYRQLIDTFSKVGGCRLNLMRLDGKCIAGQFGLVVDDTQYLLKIGYDEAFKSVGPGGLLLGELLRRSCADESIAPKVSFVTGASWNDDWAPKSFDVYHHRIFNSTVVGRSACLLEKLKPHLDQSVSFLLKSRLGDRLVGRGKS